MDDTLPVVIYTVAHVRVTDFAVQIALLADYISGSSGFDKEQRLLIDVDSAVTFLITAC